MDISSYLDPIITQAAAFLPGFAVAVGILLLGWLFAGIISKIIYTGLKKLKVNESISKLTGAKQGKPIDIARWVYKLVYLCIMLMAVQMAFEKLDISALNGPIAAFYALIFTYVIPVGILLLVAWLLATFLKTIIIKASEKANLDSTINEKLRLEGDSAASSVGHRVGEVAYWLVFLFFLPLILQKLDLNGLDQPIDAIFSNIVNFAMRLATAALIFVAFWIVAKIVFNIVSNLLDAAGLNSLTEKVGINSALGQKKPSTIVGTLVQAFILIVGAISALDKLNIDAISVPATEMLQKVVGLIPNLLAAAAIILIAYYVGKFVCEFIANFLSGIGFDHILEKLGIAGKVNMNQKRPSVIVGIIAYVAIMLIMTTQALNTAGFDSLAGIVSELSSFLGHVFFGIIILGIGLYIANIIENTVASSSAPNSKLLGQIAKVAILVVSLAMALKRMGIADEIVSLAFGLTLGALAVAFGLAFGLGGRDQAGEIVKDFVKKFKA